MRVERIYLEGEGDEAYVDAYVADPISCLTRKAILVIPGGGYGCVCADREGEPIAHAFLPYGYNAFVLHYHVRREKPFPIQLIQTAKAIKMIKDRSEEFGIDPEQLFLVGFSAGGHLAATAGVLWKLPEVYEAVPMPYGYNKPTGVILGYPVITSEIFCGTFKNLLCSKEPPAEALEQVSVERHVDADSAPAFLLHTSNDETVDVINSLRLAEAYRRAGLQFEMHIYPDGPHGVALANRITETGREGWNNPAIAEWIRLAATWAESLCRSASKEQ